MHWGGKTLKMTAKLHQNASFAKCIFQNYLATHLVEDNSCHTNYFHAFIQSFTKKQELWWCQHFFHHCLSLWQPMVTPVMTKLAIWQFSVFSVLFSNLLKRPLIKSTFWHMLQSPCTKGAGIGLISGCFFALHGSSLAHYAKTLL